MKISEMLQREDFYDILPKTLNRYAKFLGIEQGSVEVLDKGMEADMYVNEKLNAIISAKPSKNIKDYLKTEYAVNGSIIRKSMVSAYLTASTMLVKRCAQRGLSLKSSLPLNDILIYPCNKKIRLFDFSTGVVYTVLKEGFPDIYIKRETEFRQNTDVTYVPKITKSGEGYYSEKIIKNGRPLARMQDEVFVEQKKQESMDLLLSLTKDRESISAKTYLAQLKDRCMTMLAEKEGFDCQSIVGGIFEKLNDGLNDCEIELVTSHGDFQPGNIWIDAEGKIVIIDWETVKKRSPFYDYAALYCRLRNHGGLQNLCTRIKENLHLSTTDGCPVSSVLRIILAEELEYQTEELISFPDAMGVDIYKMVLNDYLELRF
jgi:hypothetical protein